MRPLELTHLDENGNPSWGFIALGESLSVQLLGIFEQAKGLNEHMLSKVGGKILGYNSYPYSIFLDLRILISLSSFHDLKVEDD